MCVINDFWLKIAACLAILSIILIIKNILLWIENQKLNDDYKELNKRHEALTKRYKSKDIKLKKMYRYWAYLENVFVVTTARTEKDRFHIAEKQYRELTNELEFYNSED